MSHRQKVAARGLAASLLVSLLATGFSGTALGAASASPATTTVVPNGAATTMPIATVTIGAPADIAAGTLTLTLPSGFTWAATGTILTVETGGTLVVTDGAITLGGTTASFTVSGAAIAGSTIAFSSPTVKTTTSGAKGDVVLSGLVSPASLDVAKLTALFGPYGAAVVYYASATHVHADGASTIVLTFAGGAGVPPAGYTISIATTAGSFTASSGLAFLIAPTYPTTSLAGITAVGAGATLTLRSAATPGPAIVSVSLVLIATGAVTSDSITTFSYTGGEGAGQGGRDADHGKGHGARKVGFFDNPAYTCATGALPVAGAKTFGFAILNTTGKRMLNVNVVLKGALANATYDVWVNQDPGACPLGAPTKAGAVHTNALGNGTGHLRIAVQAGAQHFWVSATSGASVLRTRAAALTIKGK